MLCGMIFLPQQVQKNFEVTGDTVASASSPSDICVLDPSGCLPPLTPPVSLSHSPDTIVVEVWQTLLVRA